MMHLKLEKVTPLYSANAGKPNVVRLAYRKGEDAPAYGCMVFREGKLIDDCEAFKEWVEKQELPENAVVTAQTFEELLSYYAQGYEEVPDCVFEDPCEPVNLFEDVADFMRLGWQNFPKTPPETIAPEHGAFHDRVIEEVNESREALEHGDITELLDAYIDIVFTATSAAIALVGLDAAKLACDAVVRANLRKVDESFGPVEKDADGKIQKPAGWKHPNIAGILGRLRGSV